MLRHSRGLPGLRAGLQRILACCGLALLFSASPSFAQSTAGLKKTTQATSSTQATPATSAAQQAQFEGELEVLHEDDFKNKKSRTRHFLRTASGERVELKFKGRPPHLLTGSKVRVKGTQSGGLLALDSSVGGNLQVLAAASNNTLGEQRTAVILVNFQDDLSQPATSAQVQSLVFGTVSNYFKENSSQQTWLNGSVFGWYTASFNKTCDTLAIENFAKSSAAAAGADLSSYTRFVYMFPRNDACTWAGLAFMGGSPSSAWINGYFDLGVVGHELGHNLGLNHAHGVDCDAGPLAGSCTVLDYGDGADLMGSRPGHFNAFEKEYLGWLNSGVTPPIATVQDSGSYRLDPYESSNNNTKALKILKGIDPSTGVKTWYYLEYRQPTGFDSVLDGVGNLVRGIQVRVADEVTTNNAGSLLLDMTPNSYTASSAGDLKDGALEVGRSYTDTAAGLTITTTWADASGAGVDVSFAKSSCTLGKPSLLISPAQSASVVAGAPVSYTVAVTNNDSAACPAATFNLQANLPSGWSGKWASTALTLASGNAASTTLTVTSPSSAIAGSYNVGVTASNGANTAYSSSGSAVYTIGTANLATTVATDKASYLRGDTVIIAATATANGQPLANASVSFVVAKPNGGTATASVTSDASGKAVYKLRLNKQKDPAGTYQVRDTVVNNGQSAQASTSFSAQ